MSMMPITLGFDGDPSAFGPQGGYLAQLSEQPGSIATGLPFRPMMPFNAVPGMSNPAIAMFMQPLLTRFTQGLGMTPLGVHDQNTYDVIRNQRFFQQQQQAIAYGAQMDKANWMDTMRGLARMTGTPWGGEQMRAAGGMANILATMAPTLQMMAPDLLDDLSGARGSMSIMSNRITLANRYRIDPVSGRLGYDTESNKALMQNLFETTFRNAEDVAGLRGMTAGQFGSLYETAALRGMLPGALSPRDSLAQLAARGGTGRAAIEAAAKDVGVTLPSDLRQMGSGDIDKLMTNSTLQANVRTFDAARTKKSLEGYIAAVNAVKDIFGEMGVTNAPMGQLINALERLTNGASMQVSAGRLDNMVRTTQQLANASGIGIDNMIRLQEHGAMRANALGVESIFGVHAAQNAAAMMIAYRNSGMAGHAAWDRMNIDQVTQADINLTTSAAASQSMQRFGVAVRLGEANAGFKAGTMAHAYYEALKNAQQTGATTFWHDGKEHSLNMRQGEFVAMLSKAGVDPTMVGTMLQQRELNRGAAEQIGGAQLARQQQASTDVVPILSRTVGAFLRSRTTGKNGRLSSDEARRIFADDAATDIFKQIQAMSAEDFTDDAARTAGIAKIIRGTIAQANPAAAGRYSDEELQTMATAMYGSIDRTGRAQFRLGAQNIHQLFNPELLAQRQLIGAQQKFEADTASALAPLNRGSVIRRAVTALQSLDGKSEDEAKKVLAAAFGGVPEADIREKLMPLMNQVDKTKDELAKLQTDYTEAKTPKDREAVAAKIKAAQNTLAGFATKAATVATDLGMTDDRFDVAAVGQVRELEKRSAAAWKDVSANMQGKTAEQQQEILQEFLKTERGEEYRRSTLAAGREAEGAATSVLLSDSQVLRTGEEGIANAKNVIDANNTLRQLAAKYTSGDVVALEAFAGGADKLIGGLTEKQAADVRGQIAAAKAQRAKALQDLEGGERLRNARENVTGYGRAGDTDDRGHRLNSILTGKELEGVNAFVQATPDRKGVYALDAARAFLAISKSQRDATGNKTPGYGETEIGALVAEFDTISKEAPSVERGDKLKAIRAKIAGKIDDDEGISAVLTTETGRADRLLEKAKKTRQEMAATPQDDATALLKMLGRDTDDKLVSQVVGVATGNKGGAESLKALRMGYSRLTDSSKDALIAEEVAKVKGAPAVGSPEFQNWLKTAAPEDLRKKIANIRSDDAASFKRIEADLAKQKDDVFFKNYGVTKAQAQTMLGTGAALRDKYADTAAIERALGVGAAVKGPDAGKAGGGSGKITLDSGKLEITGTVNGLAFSGSGRLNGSGTHAPNGVADVPTA